MKKYLIGIFIMSAKTNSSPRSNSKKGEKGGGQVV